MSETLHETHVAPSILSADFVRLGADVEAVLAAGARVVHVDVMDGHFVPNITIGPAVTAAVAPLAHGAGALVDVHLMIERPERYVQEFVAAGADIVTVHQEASPHLHRTLAAIRDAGAAAGVSVNPATPVETLAEARHHCDLVLVMSVDPGFGGQRFIPSSLDKLRRARAMLPPSVALEVDGGVSAANAADLVAAGANLLVAGSGVFDGRDPAARFRELAAAAGEA
ncbi:MAG TPA: ribulose-phosphate 3-epimerase [Thermoleophilia bacterium]|nr:ribulose-phosphate 3-epimerase [Thermoleophilia bacterium]HQG04083.1 ribulose-phosphate 3-epimerase [Thermoleophilia bacterium]HQG54760.1 ribulose-phosphate 3-epimerase [Thermoleophilia bacterium]HQJ96968.1 ribulose-phosphate 3-epimerase [Thermoleophilia bacterium]